MTTQGMLTTLVITAMVLFFDWRIGLVAVVGILFFFGLNSVLQKRSQKLAPIIILDEATANVDPENEKEFISVLWSHESWQQAGNCKTDIYLCCYCHHGRRAAVSGTGRVLSPAKVVTGADEK